MEFFGESCQKNNSGSGGGLSTSERVESEGSVRVESQKGVERSVFCVVRNVKEKMRKEALRNVSF